MQLVTRSADETRELGRQLSRLLRPGDVVGLVGDLGAGKTTLVQGVAAGLGVRGRVASPTFLIVHEYRNRLVVYHVDLYRMSPEDVETVGVHELFDEGGVVLIEWADRAPHLLPPDTLWVRMEIVDDTTRAVTLDPRGVRSRELAQALSKILATAQG